MSNASVEVTTEWLEVFAIGFTAAQRANVCPAEPHREVRSVPWPEMPKRGHAAFELTILRTRWRGRSLDQAAAAVAPLSPMPR
jgi:hypothetical protein